MHCRAIKQLVKPRVAVICAFPWRGRDDVAFPFGQRRVELYVLSFATLIQAAVHHEST